MVTTSPNSHSSGGTRAALQPGNAPTTRSVLAPDPAHFNEPLARVICRGALREMVPDVLEASRRRGSLTTSLRRARRYKAVRDVLRKASGCPVPSLGLWPHCRLTQGRCHIAPAQEMPVPPEDPLVRNRVGCSGSFRLLCGRGCGGNSEATTIIYCPNRSRHGQTPWLGQMSGHKRLDAAPMVRLCCMDASSVHRPEVVPTRRPALADTVKRVTVNLREEDFDRLRELADKLGLSPNEVLRRALATETFLTRKRIDEGSDVLVRDKKGDVEQVVFTR